MENVLVKITKELCDELLAVEELDTQLEDDCKCREQGHRYTTIRGIPIRVVASHATHPEFTPYLQDALEKYREALYLTLKQTAKEFEDDN